MKFINPTFAIFTSALLFGCGGGGESDVTEPGTLVSAPTENQQDDVVTTSDLNIAPDFALTTFTEVQVEVDVSDRYSNRAYLNLCSSENQSLDYNTCLLRSPLYEGKLRATVSISHHFESLAAEIIDLRQPLNAEIILIRSTDFINSGKLRIN